jgi:hypothetical protein
MYGIRRIPPDGRVYVQQLECDKPLNSRFTRKRAVPRGLCDITSTTIENGPIRKRSTNPNAGHKRRAMPEASTQNTVSEIPSTERRPTFLPE